MFFRARLPCAWKVPFRAGLGAAHAVKFSTGKSSGQNLVLPMAAGLENICQHNSTFSEPKMPPPSGGPGCPGAPTWLWPCCWWQLHQGVWPCRASGQPWPRQACVGRGPCGAAWAMGQMGAAPVGSAFDMGVVRHRITSRCKKYKTGVQVGKSWLQNSPNLGKFPTDFLCGGYFQKVLNSLPVGLQGNLHGGWWCRLCQEENLQGTLCCRPFLEAFREAP